MFMYIAYTMPADDWVTQGPLLQTQINFNPAMDK